MIDRSDYPFSYSVGKIEVLSDHQLCNPQAVGYALEARKYYKNPDIVLVRLVDESHVEVAGVNNNEWLH